jgi:HNH endonuclease
MKEKWALFRHGYYKISNCGTVVRVKGGPGAVIGKIITQWKDKDGYLRVQTWYHGRQKNHFVHVLVARKFIGKCPVGKEVNHKDLNKANPNIDNLEYLTSKNNIRHAVRRNMYGKITFNDAQAIRKLYSTGKFHRCSRTLAKKFGISRDAINDIINHQSWKEVA